MSSFKSRLFRFFARVGLKEYYYYFIFLYKRLTGSKPSDYKRLTSFYSKLIQPGTLVFDIGANVGNRSLVFRDLGARVIAFEPNPEVARILRFRFGKTVLVENKGLGKEEGQLDFFVASNSRISSFSDKFKTHKESINQTIRYKQSIPVPVTTLERAIRQHGVPAFCKIDTEGFEEQVLSGLQQCIPLISFEFTFPAFYPETIRSLQHLHQLGYDSFNVSFAETLQLAPEWMSYAQFLKRIQEYETAEATVYGDIYVRDSAAKFNT